MCLDDLKVEYEPCSQPLACTFESGDTCSWSNNREGEAAWLLTSGSTPSADTGPSYDHTVGDGTGHYLYTEASLMFSIVQKGFRSGGNLFLILKYFQFECLELFSLA